MRNALTIRCKKCKYVKDIYIGTGLIHPGVPDFDSEYAVLPKLVGDGDHLVKIKKMVEEDGGHFESNYMYGIYRCPDCGTFKKEFVYRILWEDGGIYTPTYFCEKCQSPLEALDINRIELKGFVCPECGEESLYEGFSSYFRDHP